MECVIRRRKKGMMKPLKINCNKGITILEENEEAEERAELLSPSSAAFLKPNFNIHVLAIMGIKNPIDVEILKAKFQTTLIKHPRFSSVVVGNPCEGEELKWVRTQVDIDKHVIVPKIDPTNIESPEKFLEDYLYNLSETSLDKSRPLWDMHALHLQLSEDVKGIVILRIHHSLGDGTSLISLLLALTRKTSDPEALPTIPGQATCKYNKKNGGGFLIKRWISGLWMIITLMWNTFKDILLFIATAMFLKDNSPFKNSSRGSNAPRRIVFKIFSLDDMKLVKTAMNCTINDVAVGITQAGLSRYLSRKYGNVGNNNDGNAREKCKKLLNKIRLRSVLLINTRPTVGIQALADMMEKDAEAKWGNAVGFVLLPLTLALHDDPLHYIKEAKAVVDRKKNSLEALYTFYMADIIMKFFSSKIAGVIGDRINSHTTMGFSNLAGPMEEISFYGHPLAFLAPSSYGQPHGVLLNFQSYSDKMILVVAVDEHAVPDPHQLRDDIVESLKQVKDAVISQGLIVKDSI